MSSQIPDIRYLVGTPVGDGPVKTLCPWHEEDTPSYAVYADHCYCFGCRRRESAEEFIQRLGADPAQLPRIDAQRQLLQGHHSASPRDTARVQAALRAWQRVLLSGSRQHRLAWLTERGLWQSTTERYGIGHTGSHFSIPVADGYQLRKDPDYTYSDDPKYLTPYQQPALLFRPYVEGSPTVICEGPLDTLVMAQYGFDALSTSGGAGSLGGSLVSTLRLPPGTRTFIATDQDDAGEAAAVGLAEIFPSAKRVRWEGGKDITEALLNVEPEWRGTWLKELFEQ